MSVTVSPPEADEEQPGELSELDHELELLIKEARARARRRRLAYAATALVALAGAAAYLGGGGGRGDSFGGGAGEGDRPGEVGARADARLAAAVVQFRPSARALAVHPGNPQILYAGTLQGVFKSTDGARSWRTVLRGRPDEFGVNQLAINPSNPNTVYAFTLNHGVYKTTDGGRNWHSTGLRNAQLNYVSLLVVDPARPETVYSVNADGLLKTTNGGRSWHHVRGGLPAKQVSELALDPSDPETMYAVMGNGGDRLFVSRDGGRNWRPRTIRRRSYIPSVAFNPHEPGTVYVSTQTGIYKSIDHGASWREVNTRFMTGDRRAEAPLAFSPTTRGTIYAQTYCKGVFKSIDSGQSWQTANSGLRLGCRPPYGLTFDPRNPNTIYALVPDYGLYKSIDGARHWQRTAQPPE